MTALAAAALAGCADVENHDVEDVGDLFHAAGLAASHPQYGFLTNDALVEAPEPGVVYDDVDGQRVWYKPAYRGLPNGISGLERLAAAENTTTAGGIAVFGSLAFIGDRTEGPLQVIDISIPTEPRQIGSAVDVPVRDADTILFPDGRLIVISTAGGTNIFATDVTDPSNATMVGQIETVDDGGANHNIAVVPGTPIVYNSLMQIVDFSTPEEPALVSSFEGGDGCHDIAFYINATQDKYWALCAGYEHTEIWDIADPLAPELVVEIDYPSMDKGTPFIGERLDDAGVPQDPVAPVSDQACGVDPSGQSCGRGGYFPLSFSHLAIVNHDATVLIMGDETGGGGMNGCDFRMDGPDGQQYSGPIGNLWFYDITDPEEPDLRGHISPGYDEADDTDPVDGSATGESCTAHFGKVIEDTGHLVMAYYTAGIVLVDFNDLDNPQIVDRYDGGSDTWDAQYHQGYLLTGDMRKGMEVLALS